MRLTVCVSIWVSWRCHIIECDTSESFVLHCDTELCAMELWLDDDKREYARSVTVYPYDMFKSAWSNNGARVSRHQWCAVVNVIALSGLSDKRNDRVPHQLIGMCNTLPCAVRCSPRTYRLIFTHRLHTETRVSFKLNTQPRHVRQYNTLHWQL